jgi:hypothetical protein
MKKITIAFCALLSFQFGFSQSDCSTALPITPGITSVATITGTAPTEICDEEPAAAFGAWYTYTPAASGLVTVSSDLPANAGGDTNLMVYSGSCTALVCEAFEDDVDLEGGNYLSTVQFLATGGVTYYIAWDDRWLATAFTFELTFETPACNDIAPYNQTFDDNSEFLFCYTSEDVDGDGISWISQQDLDLDGDGTNETFATNGNSTAGPKNDWLFSAGFSLTGGIQYQVISRFNTVGATAPNTASLEAFMTDSPSSSAATQIPLFSQTGITTQGEFATLESMAYEDISTFTPPSSGTYHIAYRSFGPGASGFVLLFDSNIDTTLGVSELDTNILKHYYDTVSDELTLKSSNLAFDTITIHNVMGQEVLNKNLSQTTENLNLSELNDGIYFANVTLAGRLKTVRFLKH